MTLRARLLAAVSYVLLLAILAFGLPLAVNLRARVNAEVRTQAQAQADLVAATAGDLLTPARRGALSVLARNAAQSLRGRVLIVGPTGLVLADSAGPAELGSPYGSRPELARALGGHPVQVQRGSRTLGQEILATAVPIVHDGRTAGAVRVTQSVAAVHRAVLKVELALVAVALVVLALGLLAGGVLAAHIGRPLRRLEAVARRVARGDLRARAAVEGSREQQSLARSFNEMTERTTRLLAAQREFVADASHQLRTPLTGLRLRLEAARAAVLEARGNAPDAGASDARATAVQLEAALTEVDRLSRIVTELLALSRAGQRVASGATVDLAPLAQSAAARWTDAAAGRGIELQVELAAPGARTWAAPADVERALDVLIENAVRYSPPDTAVTVVAGEGRVEVRDRGPGIGADERESIFERFHRGRTGRASGPASGFGLGLPIARELARAWGGDVRLEPRAGGGTAALLELPALDLTPAPRDAETAGV